MFYNKEEFMSRFPALYNDRNYFIESRVFDHGESPGSFSNILDTPHIWMIAAEFMKAIWEE